MPRTSKHEREEEVASDEDNKRQKTDPAAEKSEAVEEESDAAEEADKEEEAPANEGGFVDEDLSCIDCNNGFVFTIGEQEFFAEKGFTNKPSRCADCKRAKKDRMNGGGRDGGGRGGGGGAPVCYANQRGECTRGDQCRFSHGGGGGGGGRGGFGGDRGGRGGRGGDRGGRGGGGGGGGVCYANQKGECTRGDSCRFSHN